MGTIHEIGKPPKRAMLYNDYIASINEQDINYPSDKFNSFLEEHNIKLYNYFVSNNNVVFTFTEYSLDILNQYDIMEIGYCLNLPYSENRILHQGITAKEKTLGSLDVINSDISKIYEFLSNKKCDFYLENESDSFLNKIKMVYNHEKYIELTQSEKFLAALAFIFAFRKYIKLPFCAFDSIDFGLDSDTTKRLADYIKEQSKDKQYIVVSMRNPMLDNCDNVINLS